MTLIKWFSFIVFLGCSLNSVANEQVAKLSLLESKYENSLVSKNAKLRQTYLNELKGIKVEKEQTFNFDELEPLLPKYKEQYGEHSKEMVALYLKLATTLSGNLSKSKYKKRKSYFVNAVNIAKRYAEKEPEYQAFVYLNVASELVPYKRVSSIKPYELLIEAKQYYEVHHPKNSLDRISVNLYLGTYFSAWGKVHKRFGKQIGKRSKYKKHYKKAVKFLNDNHIVLQAIEGPSHKLDVINRAVLISALEGLGDSGIATEHCVSIGKMSPWTDSQEQTPLYRMEPLYPWRERSKNNEGSVTLKFTVSEEGFVINPEVVSSIGGVQFEQEAIKAVKDWRYAPKFENGKAVAATTQVQLDFKMMKD